MKLAVLVTILCLDDKKKKQMVACRLGNSISTRARVLHYIIIFLYYPHLSLAQHETRYRKLIKSQDIHEYLKQC